MPKKNLSIKEHISEFNYHVLSNFYDSLPRMAADDFRKSVMSACAWTYAVWLTRKNGKTKITKLESNEIQKQILLFTPYGKVSG